MINMSEVILVNEPPAKEVMYKFDVLFLKRFSNVSSKLRLSLELSGKVFHLFCFLLLLRLIQEYLTYNVGLITAGYYKVIGSRDLHGFLRQTLISIGLIIIISLILSVSKYVTSLLYLSWRKILTRFIHNLYFERDSFYYINVIDQKIDNPDQRITQDVDKFCSILSTILPTLLISPFTIAYYTYVSYNTAGWIGPTSVVCYFLIGTFINKWLMSAVVGYVYLQEKLEGHFRYQHMHVRTNAESIAFQCGSNSELFYADRSLTDLVKAQEKQFLRRFPLDISVNLFNYLGSIVSFLVLAIPVFSGKYKDMNNIDLSALISKNTFVTMYLISCFSNLVSLSEDFATLAGITHRVAGLLEYLEHAVTINRYNNSRNDDTFIERRAPKSPPPLLQIDNLSYTLPDNKTFLLENLNLILNEKNNILICGKSGTGKTSLFRILKGLWPSVLGTFEFASSEFNYAIFMPQKALLLPNGTLRQQIEYPFLETEQKQFVSDEDIMNYLEITGLSSLVKRISPSGDKSCLDLNPEWNWYDTLSPGEMQRLAFLRIFYQRPKIAFLDEALSAISCDMENQLYEICHELGVTLVSIGYRASLLKHHKVLLHLCGDKKWTIQNTENCDLLSI